ncbi:hypothetical protein B1C78_10965 [Thioalkalivibrio denitrificans]|uniref:Uncharacterized protein n=1 Tax=Thioalkalivibrio denitrificans TaxID=108003 RepID=A0A1V3NFS8_9GAMM|nr:hypothetical protein [Thioalkalivibrio denitrificans]OOG23636.1 hypothetical protein B1C78_10965 [Thioalkalivibrio denitrificans]
MHLPPFDVSYLHETFSQVSRDVVEAYEDLSDPRAAAEQHQTPAMLVDAMEQLLELYRRIEEHQGDLENAPDAPPTLDERELTELGEFGVQLLNELAVHAAQLGLERQSETLRELTFPLAVWIARNGGELRILQPVVTAIADRANRTSEPAILEELFRVTAEIVEHVDEQLRQDVEKSDPMRPWRILLLNFSIIATRSHQPALMEHAYDTLIHYLPEEAPEFFRQGMEQMEALDYPAQVREVVSRYHEQWGRPRTIH